MAIKTLKPRKEKSTTRVNQIESLLIKKYLHGFNGGIVYGKCGMRTDFDLRKQRL